MRLNAPFRNKGYLKKIVLKKPLCIQKRLYKKMFELIVPDTNKNSSATSQIYKFYEITYYYVTKILTVGKFKFII